MNGRVRRKHIIDNHICCWLLSSANNKEESVPQKPHLLLATSANKTLDICNEVLNALYTACDEQMLWCDGLEDECTESTPSRSSKRQKKSEEHVSRCEEKEQQVEHLAEELQELHGDKLELNDTQYCLWARTIVTGNHGTTHLLDPPHYRSYS